MSETVSRLNVFCDARGCQLKPVMAGQCIFHAGIERRYWGEVTRFLNSAEGAKVIAKSRKNRMLWALGIQNEFEQYHANDEHPFNTHEALKDVLAGLKRNNSLPACVDNADFDTIVKTLQGRGFIDGEKDGKKNIVSLDSLCQTYEQLLVNYVAERAGKKE